MIRNYICIVIIAMFLVGCSPTRDSWIIKDANKYKFESACVIVDEDGSPEYKETIANNLTQRGVKVYQASSTKDCQADFVVLYYDKYGLDIIPPVIFLTDFGIRFFDPKSDSVLVTADYLNKSGFNVFTQHRVPGELLDSMFDNIKSQTGAPSDKAQSQAGSSTKSLTQKLQELQTALDSGLITKEEYQLKRKEIIEKH